MSENDNYLYPRLSDTGARALLSDLRGLPLEELFDRSGLTHPDAAPAATGGKPADTERLKRVRDVVRAVALDYGYPQPLRQSRQAEFDRLCATLLFREMGIVPADAATKQVWSFLTLVLLPEITWWRFRVHTEERLLGGIRNTFQRLWWRSWALGPDLTAVPSGCVPFGEDDYVQVMERPTLGGNQRVARAIQDAVWRVDLSAVDISRSHLMRGLVIRVRAERSHIALDLLTESQLTSLFDVLVARAITHAK